MITLSGIYQRPSGEIVPGATITFTQLGNSANSFNQLSAEMLTGDDGSYSLSLFDGMYNVDAQYQNKARLYLGNITITANSKDGTLNDYLTISCSAPNNAILDAMQQIYFATEALAGNPATTVTHQTDIPANASGFYLVLEDEQKNATTLYLYVGGRRYWMAMVDDT
jgi:uncharacterized membrane protein